MNGSNRVRDRKRHIGTGQSRTEFYIASDKLIGALSKYKDATGWKPGASPPKPQGEGGAPNGAPRNEDKRG